MRKNNLKFTAKIAIALALVLSYGCGERPQIYCGKVSEKYLIHKNNGGTHNVVFYSYSLHKFVNASVTEDCYVNTKKGETVCFTLYDFQVGK